MTELVDIASENKQQWKAINDLAAEVKTLTGTVAAQNDTIKELVALLKKALSCEFYVIVILIAALVYGAVGKDGFFAVRGAFPIPGGEDDDDDDKAALAQPIAPPPDNRFYII